MNDPQPRPFTAIDFIKNFVQLVMTYPKVSVPYPFVLDDTTSKILESLEPRIKDDLYHSIQCLYSAALLYRGTGFIPVVDETLTDARDLETIVVHIVESRLPNSIHTPLTDKDSFLTPEETIGLMSDERLRQKIRDLDKSLWLKAKRHLPQFTPSNGCHPSYPNWLENGVNPFTVALYLDVRTERWEPVQLILKERR
jgi:hypothetical protein